MEKGLVTSILNARLFLVNNYFKKGEKKGKTTIALQEEIYELKKLLTPPSENSLKLKDGIYTDYLEERFSFRRRENFS